MQLYSTETDTYDPLKVNVCSETKLLNIHGEGVSTAFVECAELLEEKHDIDVLINNQGQGDILHSHTYGPYFFIKGLWYRGRKILTVHVIPDSIVGSLPFAGLLMPFVRWYFKQVYSYADVLVAISPMVEQAIRGLGVKTKIVSIGNPIHTKKWKRTESLRKNGRGVLGLADDDFCVLSVGQLQQRKGPDDFIEIAKQLPDVQFRWIGGRPMGLMTEGIKRLDHKISCAPENVKFSGMFDLSEMPALYAAADAFIFLSYQENSPLAPIEAAASGMPVMYRDLQEYKMLYKNEYCKGNTLEDFTHWIRKLKDDKTFYDECVLTSEKLIKQFDKEQIRRELIGLYKDVFENSQVQSTWKLPQISE